MCILAVACILHLVEVALLGLSYRLNKPVDSVIQSERERTKRVVYSIMYGVGTSLISSVALSIVWEYVFLRFFENPKKIATFYVFLKQHFKKRKKRNPRWNLHYSSKTMYVYYIYVLNSCKKDKKSDWVWYLGLKI